LVNKEAMKLALEALQTLHDENMDYLTRNKLGGENNQCMVFAREAITALREALAEQPAQQEPVAWPCLIAEADFSKDTVILAMQCTDYKVSAGKHWLSNTPPAQRTWVGLTDEQIEDIWADCPIDWDDQINILTFARAIEAAHGIKENT